MIETKKWKREGEEGVWVWESNSSFNLKHNDNRNVLLSFSAKKDMVAEGKTDLDSDSRLRSGTDRILRVDDFNFGNLRTGKLHKDGIILRRQTALEHR